MYIIFKKPIYRLGAQGDICSLLYGFVAESSVNSAIKIMKLKGPAIDEVSQLTKTNAYSVTFLKGHPFRKFNYADITSRLETISYKIHNNAVVEKTNVTTMLSVFTMSLLMNFKYLIKHGYIEVVETLTDNDVLQQYELAKTQRAYINDKANRVKVIEGFVSNLKLRYVTSLSPSLSEDTSFFEWEESSNRTIGYNILTNYHHDASNEAALHVQIPVEDAVVLSSGWCDLSNSNISCGVAQLYHIDEFYTLCNTFEVDYGIKEEVIANFILKVRVGITMLAKGKTLIFSTRKKTIKTYKKYVKLFKGDLPTVTRYSMNPNSNNKIGTTILILN